MTADYDEADIEAAAEAIAHEGHSHRRQDACRCGSDSFVKYRDDARAVLAAVAPSIAAKARVGALSEFADSRGVNVGDDDSEWWKGYRQAQRECLHDANDAARVARDTTEEPQR